MRGDVVIRAEALGKKYLIGHDTETERYVALRDVVARSARSLARTTSDMLHGRAIVTGDTTEEIWALKNVDFEVKRGEVIGVIGRNGAGKSTLLKILSRITDPSEGQVTLLGRVVSLLEVGTGFHPELTGRENIYLNGAILGMTRAEIRVKFDEIVAFAEVDKFLDTPVKRYSSGMYVRLAFAVAAHLEPEILLVDEVLAVGDVAFQNKCLGKMSSAARSGRTVLYVSHNLGAVRALCSRGILLRNGHLVGDAPIDTVVAEYLRDGRGVSDAGGRWTWDDELRPQSPEIELMMVEIAGARSGVSGQVTPDENLELTFRYRQRENLSGERFVFQFITAGGEVAFTATDHAERNHAARPPGLYESVCKIPGGLLNRGIYYLRFWAGIPSGQGYLIWPVDIGSLSVAGVGNQGTTVLADNWPGAVCPKLEWRIEAVAERKITR
ncbi:MAG TPA: polysaccharide ABC transporter ATP-binding protein [Xanthobacteraceae bacterium]|jgi:lipopolysaccharide transport system ATP-binding protein|nr:polysaccharide ABC transporter ATP-binding protein [Xanthobacteraceae bacterium]